MRRRFRGLGSGPVVIATSFLIPGFVATSARALSRRTSQCLDGIMRRLSLDRSNEPDSFRQSDARTVAGPTTLSTDRCKSPVITAGQAFFICHAIILRPRVLIAKVACIVAINRIQDMIVIVNWSTIQRLGWVRGVREITVLYDRMHKSAVFDASRVHRSEPRK